MERFLLTCCGKMGYIDEMIVDLCLFALRLLLTVAICAFVWTLVKPRTQSMRIVRAALLVLCLLGALVALRGASGG
jgi:hypothetical protein